ncbi:hypothetical protein ACFLU8_00735 [Chloroflexota bacterium]
MRRIGKLLYWAITLSLVLLLMFSTNIVMAQDGGEPCDSFTFEEYWDVGWGMSTPWWYAQIFTAHWDYDIDQVALFLAATKYEGGEVPVTVNVTVSLMATDDQGLPIQPPLGTYTGSITTENWVGTWQYFHIEPDVPVTACEKYAIVISVPEQNDPNDSLMVFVDHDDQYKEGYYLESADGINWIDLNPDADLYFILYGDCEGDPAVCVQPSPPPSQPPPSGEAVGGDVFTVDKLSLIIPLIALAVIILAGGMFLVRRRVHS